MEDWKITLAEGIVNYSKSGKKDVKITTKDNKTGAQVAQAMSANMQHLCADFKKITKNNNKNWSWGVVAEALVAPLAPGAGISTVAGAQAIQSGWKTFYVVTGSKQAQQQLMNNIKKVKNEVSEYKNASPAPQPVEEEKSLLSDNKTLVIAVLIIVALLIWALWK